MVPKGFAGEWRMRLLGVAHETSSRMGVEREEERNKQVMGVPERLKRLLSDSMVRRCIDQHHAEEHNVAGDPTCSSKMYLNGHLIAHVIFLDMIEAALSETSALKRLTYLT